MHIPGAWSLDLNGNFPIFAGWVLSTDTDILLVADSAAAAAEATVWARRVGLDRVAAYLAGAMSAWVTAGYAAAALHLLSAAALRAGLGNVALVDVRTPQEFAAGHIAGATNIPAPDLRARYTELDPAQPTVLLCSTGPRGSLAASILKQRGFAEVYNVAGGTAGYNAACARVIPS